MNRTLSRRVEDGLIGARAALDTLDELLGAHFAEQGLDEDEHTLTLAEVRHLIRKARGSISEGGTA